MASKSAIDSGEFISLNVKASALRRMLSGQNLHLADIHCSCAQSKQKLQQLLLQTVSGEHK